MNAQNEMPGHLVGQLLNGRLGGLGILYQLDDLGQGGILAHPGGLELESAGLVKGAADNLIAGLLFYRHALAGNHGLVDRRITFRDFAVHRDSLARTHYQNIVDLHLFGRNFQFLAVT